MMIRNTQTSMMILRHFSDLSERYSNIIEDMDTQKNSTYHKDGYCSQINLKVLRLNQSKTLTVYSLELDSITIQVHLKRKRRAKIYIYRNDDVDLYCTNRRTHSKATVLN